MKPEFMRLRRAIATTSIAMVATTGLVLSPALASWADTDVPLDVTTSTVTDESAVAETTADAATLAADGVTPTQTPVIAPTVADAVAEVIEPLAVAVEVNPNSAAAAPEAAPDTQVAGEYDRSSAVYLYQQVVADVNLTYANSGEQNLVLTVDGWLWLASDAGYRAALRAALPANIDFCEPWAVQEDQIHGSQDLFPETIRYAEGSGFDDILEGSQHSWLNEALGISPDCSTNELPANMPSLTVALTPCPGAPATSGVSSATVLSATSEPSSRQISVRASNLTPNTVYVLALVNVLMPSGTPPVATVSTPSNGGSEFSHTFTDVPAPGTYRVFATSGQVSQQSAEVDAAICPPQAVLGSFTPGPVSTAVTTPRVLGSSVLAATGPTDSPSLVSIASLLLLLGAGAMITGRLRRRAVQ
jgi:hypothetical protein